MLLANGFPPDIRVYKEAKTLTENGKDVEIFCWDRLGEFKADDKLDDIKVTRVGPKSSYGNTNENMLMMPFFWKKCFFKCLNSGAKVIHCHDFDTLIPGFLAAKLSGKKIVYDSHENYTASIKNKVPSPICKIISITEKFMSKRCDYVITINQLIGDIFESNGAKVLIIMNAQDSRQYDIEYLQLEKIREKFAGKDKFVICYIGGLRKERCLGELLESIDYLSKTEKNKVKILIIGRGPDKEELEKTINTKYNKNACIKDFIDPFLVPAYTLASDGVYCVGNPKLYKNVEYAASNKLFESICAHKPIIVNDVGIMGDVISENRIGAIVKNTPQSIAGGIRKIMQMSKSKEFYQKSKKAEIKYNWESESKKLLNMYSKII